MLYGGDQALVVGRADAIQNVREENPSKLAQARFQGRLRHRREGALHAAAEYLP